MSSIHNSAKALFSEVFSRYQEALLNQEPERAARFRNVIEEVFNNTIDDNAKLLDQLNACKRQPIGDILGATENIGSVPSENA
jgi:hypothetical protein